MYWGVSSWAKLLSYESAPPTLNSLFSTGKECSFPSSCEWEVSQVCSWVRGERSEILTDWLLYQSVVVKRSRYLSGDFLLACPTGSRPQVRPKTYCRDYISQRVAGESLRLAENGWWPKQMLILCTCFFNVFFVVSYSPFAPEQEIKNNNYNYLQCK